LAGAASLRLVQQVQDGAVMHDLLRLAKGLRYGAALSSGAAFRFRPDPRLVVLKEKIDQWDASHLAVKSPAAPAGKMSELGELLLISPQSEGEVRLAGRSARESLANLQHQFEIEVDRTLSSLAADAGLAAVSSNALATLLDAETVLLEYYLTQVGDAELVVLFLRSTAGARLSAVQLGAGTAQRTLVLDGAVSELSEVAARVLQLRRAVNEPPGNGPLSRNAEHRLTGDAELLLAGLPAVLEGLRAEGKRHLCVVPHGALHVAPLHLLHVNGRPLAADWLVTYLPNLHLVTRRADDEVASAKRAQLTAIGVSFTRENPFRLLSLENVVSEVHSVARTLSGTMLLDEQATRTAILQALETSRYVHLATHGAHNPFAASFQCLYCSPGDGGDGRLFAHELLGHDFRGLDLVTLSACETALGRFDAGDNLRGIPAALFLGGARTIIGTLWDLETNAAETFFTALYAAIARGETKGAAFAEAQRTTRSQHPEYRDWGAFYFAGDWR
jgi:CHAT domain-containing protein